MQIITRFTSAVNDKRKEDIQESAKLAAFDNVLLSTDHLIANDDSQLQELCVSPIVVSCLQGKNRTIITYSFDYDDLLWLNLLLMAFHTFISKMDSDSFIQVTKSNTDNSNIPQCMPITDASDLMTLADERGTWLVIKMDVISGDEVNTLTVVNIVDDESMECASTLLDEIHHAKTALGKHLNLHKEDTTVIVEIGEDKNDVYRSIQLVKQLLESKDEVNLMQMPPSTADHVFKLKYDSALKKMIELEAKLEASQIGDGIKNYTDLKTENFKLKNQIALYEEMLQRDIKTFDKSIVKEIEQRVTEKIGLPDSDSRIFKKLLLSKTDKLLQLEYEVEELNKKNLNLKKQNSSDNVKQGNTLKSTSKETEESLLLAMTETIQNQQVHLEKELERAEAELKKKEKLLEEKNGKWIQRNEMVNKEQNEVEKKLENMGNRFKSIAANAENLPRQYPVSIENTPKTPIRSRSERDESESETRRKGLNFNIIKPF